MKRDIILTLKANGFDVEDLGNKRVRLWRGGKYITRKLHFTPSDKNRNLLNMMRDIRHCWRQRHGEDI